MCICISQNPVAQCGASLKLLFTKWGHASPESLTAVLHPGPESPPRSSGWSGSDTRSRSAGFRSWSPGRRNTHTRGVGELWAGAEDGPPAALPARCAARQWAPTAGSRAARTSAWARRTTLRSFRQLQPCANEALLLFPSAQCTPFCKVIRQRGRETPVAPRSVRAADISAHSNPICKQIIRAITVLLAGFHSPSHFKR